MTEILLFTIDGHRYGFRKDHVSSIEKVGAVHRLPFLKSSLTVIAVTGDRTRTLADLALCLGHSSERRDGGANALLMSEQGQIKGFLLGVEFASRQVESDTVVPLPDYLFIPFIEGFLPVDAELVPMVAVRPLFDEVAQKGNPPNVHARAIASQPALEASSTSAFKLVNARGNLLAFDAGELFEMPGSHRISRFPLLPPDADGVTIFDNRILPVVDLARRVSRLHVGENPLMLEARLGDEAFGLLVDDTQGEWLAGDTVIKDLPFVCRTPWSTRAAMHGAQVAAIIDLATLLSTDDGAAPPTDLSVGYEPESSFPSTFGTEDAQVVELPVRGWRFAIPKDEVMDTIPCASIHSVPHAPGIVIGVGLFEGELLPVLDLARILGASSSPTAQWRMIPVSNGSFRALVLSEGEPETRLLKAEAQRDVPVHLPYPVVYGCYTVGEAIRLILNLNALAVHFDESRAVELLATFSPGEVTRESEVEPQGETVQTTEPDTTAELEQTPGVDQNIETDQEREPEPKSEADQKLDVVQEPEPDQKAQEPQTIVSPIQVVPPQPSEEIHIAEPVVDAAAAEQLAADEVPTLFDEEQIEMPGPYSPEPVPTPDPASSPQPAPAIASPAPAEHTEAIQEEERFVEEVRVRKQAVVEQPARRGPRMAVAFVISALVIAGAVSGLYFSGLAREPTTSQATVPAPSAQQTSAQQPTQPAPAVSTSAALPAASVPGAAPKPEQASSPIYVVKKGDTLWDIAQRLTGDPLNYHNLAGRNLIKNPDLIFPGQTIQIGPAEK